MKDILIKTERPRRSVVFKALEGSGIEETSIFQILYLHIDFYVV